MTPIMQKTEIAQATGWADDVGQVNVDPPTTHEPTQNAAVEPNSVDQNAPAHDALLDAEDKVAPNKINTERPLWRHPIPRTALVVAGAGIIGTAIVQMTQGNSLISSGQNPVAATPTPTATPQVSGSESGDLKARLASIELKQKLQKLKEDRAAAQKAANTTASQSIKSQPTPVASLPPARSAAYSPSTSYTPRSVAQPTPVQPQPVQIQPQAQRVQPVQPQPVQPQPVKDPTQQWLEAANAGSYAGTSSGTHSQASNYPQPTTEATDAATSRSLKQSSATLATGQSQTSYQAQNVQPVQLSTPYQSSSNSFDPSRQISLGTKAAGQVERTISWSGNHPQSLTLPNLLIKITKSLKATDGKYEVIPKGSLLVAQITSADNSGLLQLSVVSVYLNLDGQLQTNPTALPTGAIEISAQGDRPLQAKSHFPRAGRSFLSQLGDAAGMAGLATNRTSLYMLSALQSNRQNFSSQTGYFSLEAGTLVQLYVNSSFALSGIP